MSNVVPEAGYEGEAEVKRLAVQVENLQMSVDAIQRLLLDVSTELHHPIHLLSNEMTDTLRHLREEIDALLLCVIATPIIATDCQSGVWFQMTEIERRERLARAMEQARLQWQEKSRVHV